MEKILRNIAVFLAIVFGLGAGFYAMGLIKDAQAEEMLGEENSLTEEGPTNEEPAPGISISISPVSKILQIAGGNEYEDSFKITNGGGSAVKFEVYAAPYSYIYSEENDSYTLGFNRENSYTQITRWITFKDADGNWVKNPQFKVEAGESVDVTYKITTPESIPSGGQYAVLFAHTLSDTSEGGGIKTEASPGLVVYGRSLGETNISSEIRDLSIEQWIKKDSTEEDAEGNKIVVTKDYNHISAQAKIKNTGNVDFNAIGKLKVDGILGGAVYETPANRGRISIIPEAELVVSDEWEETPAFGIFRVTWTVTAGDNTETITSIVAINIAPLIIVVLIVLTIIIVGIIMRVKKRKERRSRFAV